MLQGEGLSADRIAFAFISYQSLTHPFPPNARKISAYPQKNPPLPGNARLQPGPKKISNLLIYLLLSLAFPAGFSFPAALAFPAFFSGFAAAGRPGDGPNGRDARGDRIRIHIVQEDSPHPRERRLPSLGEIARLVINNLDSLTNGPKGMQVRPWRPLSMVSADPNIQYYLLILAGVAAGVVASRRIEDSRVGRAWVAIREDEIAAEAMGISLFKHKSMSFIISSFFSALAGGMLAMYMRSIEAKTFSITLTYDILLIVVIGGIGSVTGSVLGAFLVTASKEWWLRFFDQPLELFGWDVPLFRTGFRMVIFSILLMMVVLIYRRGLMGTNEFSWDRIFGRFKWKRKKVQGGGS